MVLEVDGKHGLKDGSQREEMGRREAMRRRECGGRESPSSAFPSYISEVHHFR